MPTIITVTMNPVLDKSSNIEHVVPEHKLRCHSLQCEPGGGGINVSRAIQKLGGESLAFYVSGGVNGQLLRSLLDQEGLNHRPIPIEDSTRESLMVLESATGQQFRFGFPGPKVQDAEWQQCLDELARVTPAPAYLVASGSLSPGVPDDFYARVAQLAKKFASRFIVDTSKKTALQLALREGVYLIKPNLREFRELVGSELETEAEQESQARELVERGQCEVVVVSLGAAGVLLVSKETCEHLRAPTVPIKSKVGAGDSTVAGMTLGLAQGKSLREAVRFGVAAGAATVMTPGTELCRREDTERLYQSLSEG